MEVFNKLNAVEDEVFTEMENINKEIVTLREKLFKLRGLAKVMNPERVKNLKSKVNKK